MSSNEIRKSLDVKPKIFYGYFIVILAFLIMLVGHGVFSAFGVFFNPVLVEFGWTRAMTSGAFSLALIIFGVMGVVMGRLTDRYGPRIVITICGILLGLGYLLMSQIGALWHLYLFYGVIIGLGMAGAWVPLLSITARWFVKRRSVMTGFVAAGVGVGGLITPLVANQLIIIYEWRIAYAILGGIVLIIVVTAAQFLKRDPSQKGLSPYGSDESKEAALEPVTKSVSLTETLRHRQIWLLTTSVFCFGFFFYTITVHIAPHAIVLGNSTTTAANILAIVGGISIIGNIVFGGVGDKIGNKWAYVICFIIMSAGLFWLVPSTEVWALFLIAGVFGFARGGADTVESPLTADLFGLKSHGVIYGVVALSFTIGAAIGPFLAGYIFDVTNSYELAFLICAVISVIGLGLIITLRPIKRLKSEA
ncbi:MFS transporter [Chloroflexota bacterium]